jgi:hypothetical protein
MQPQWDGALRRRAQPQIRIEFRPLESLCRGVYDLFYVFHVQQDIRVARAFDDDRFDM